MALIKKILIIQQKMIGDVLLTSVLAEILKQKYPESQIHYLVESHTQQVVEHNPYIEKLIVIEKGSLKKISNLIELCASLRKQKYDVVIDAYGKLSSLIMTSFSNAKIKIGKYKWYSHLLYNHTIKYKTEDSSISGLQHYYRLQLLCPLGIENKSVYPKIYLTNQEKEKADTVLKSFDIPKNRSLIMISLLGSDFKKSYPNKYMVVLLEYLVKTHNFFLVFNYMPNQEKDALKIINQCSPDTHKNFILDIQPKGLREFIALLSRCDAIIGNEGGAINMAKALDIPSFAIFSPWHNKKHWNHMEDSIKHNSVHLKEFKPELIYLDNKKIRDEDEIASLYDKFHPNLFLEDVNNFIELNIETAKN